MNKYSRQLRIGRVFVCSASSGRKYAILADFTQCFVTQHLTLFCRLLSPFLRCRTGFFALRKSPFRVAIWYVRHRHTGNLAVRKSLFRPPSSHCIPVSSYLLRRPPSSHFPPPVNPKNASPTPLFLLLNPHFSPYPFLFPHFPLPNLFYSRKRINIHSLTLSPPHPLTLLYILPSFPVPSFPFFTSLIFSPFTLKNFFFPFTLFPFPASYNSFSSF